MPQGPSQALEEAPDPGCPWSRAGAKVMIVMTPLHVSFSTLGAIRIHQVCRQTALAQ